MIFFHVTERAAVPDILSRGFLPDWGDWGFGVYLFDNLTSARRYAERGGWDGSLKNPVILQVATERATQGYVPEDWDAAKYASIWYVDLEDQQDDADPRFVPDAVTEVSAAEPPIAAFLAGRRPAGRPKRRVSR